jgi:Fe-S-cluster containining protein
MASTTERLDISIITPAGPVSTAVEIPTDFIPISAIVPLMRQLGEQAQVLEERRAVAAKAAISCREGCAACCRMLVPLSAPEAFALREYIGRLPEERRQRLLAKIADSQTALATAGLLSRLHQVADDSQQLQDEDMEAINRDYYRLRMPCPFLEEERCSIYEERPAACRELQVTSPAEYCRDMVANPVRTLPVPVRIGTALSLLWAELAGGPARLIPLPIALDWAERRHEQGQRTWKGMALLEKALDSIWKLLAKGKE